LHIVCHGRYIKDSTETALYFPKDGSGTPVTGSELIDRLGRLDRLPHLAFLSTCESAAPGAESGLGGLGQRLVRDLGMPAVVAMTDRISIETAGKLASAFYSRLREHGEVDCALSESYAGLQGRDDVTVPALFSRLGGQPLFSESLNRPLTSEELKFGLETMRNEMALRAPILLPDFESQAARLQPALQADTQALSTAARADVEAALTALNQLSLEVCDLSFNALALGQTPPPYDARCPFRGLSPFRTEDREFFMGREALTAKLAGRLKDYPFLAVLGPSGSGKSSLVLAGLVPLLQKDVAYLTPGTDPLGHLASALHSPQQVVVVDQFEELFTLTVDASTRRAFIERLLQVKEQQPVVLTMRADFWGDVAAYEHLKEEMQAHQELVAPMDAAELRSAMEQQASHVGLRFEADLPQTILDDVQGEPGAMPLLQHALLLLWNRRHGRWLRTAEYRAIGGVQQAIAHTAEDVYAGLSAAEKERMRDIFLRLTRLDDESALGERRDTRRRVRLAELVPAGADQAGTVNLVSRLADARLAVTSRDPVTGEDEVEVAHEALIRYWPRLQSWLEQDRTGLLMRQGLRQAASDWAAAGRDENLLVHRGRRLEDALELRQQPRFALNQAEQDYLSACVALQRREQVARERRRRLVLFTSIAVSVVTLALAIFGLAQARLATRQAVLARSGQLSAQSLYYFDKKLDLSLLLAVEAFRQQDNPQTRSSLFGTLSTPYLERFLAGHSGPVRAVAFSPDGSLLASAGHDHTVILWDMHDPAAPSQLAVLQGHENWVTSIAFSPDGRLLASGGNDRSVILWDISDPKHPSRLARLIGYPGSIYSVALSADGRLLAAAGEGGGILLWDVSAPSAPRQLPSLTTPTARVISLAFNPKSSLLAAGGTQGALMLWDLSSPGSPQELPLAQGLNTSDINGLAFSPDGRRLASGGAQGIDLWDLGGGAQPQLVLQPPFPRVHSDAVRSLAFSPDGGTLASGSGDTTVVLWDLTNASAPVSQRLAGHSAVVYALAFSPDGSTLASAGGDQRIILWHVHDSDAPRQLGRMVDPMGRVTRLAYSPDGRTIASAGVSPITLWDVSKPAAPVSLASLASQEALSEVDSLGFSPDGRTLASGGRDGKLTLWDTSDPAAPHRLAVLEGHSDSVLSLAFSPDGKTLASGDHAHRILLWDVTEPTAPRQLAALDGHTGFVNSLAFSADGKTLASGSADHTIILWDVSDPSAPRRLSVLAGHSLEVYDLAFVPGGTVLASAGADTRVILWDVKNRVRPRQLAVLRGHTGPVFDVAASPDGRTLASAGGDKLVLLWDISDPALPRQVANLQGHSDSVNAIAFDPTGRVLASAGDDSTILLWNTDAASLVQRACEIAGRNLSQAEWLEFFPGQAYHSTCSQWPAGE
jgi:WD40 repeat protein/ABC-type Mn2+/Zn2+ transport system ATPase subunit